MNRIITISREFGSGGRELGKRLAEALHIPCYDHEIIEMIAKENGFNEDYVAHVSEKSIEAAYPLTIGHRFGVPPFQIMDQPIRVAVTQRKILENFAKSGDCVIVGRGADVILKDYKPLNIFVTLREGKFHQVKRMLAARGAPVLYLKRLSMGPLTLDAELPIGGWRELTAEETASLRCTAGL